MTVMNHETLFFPLFQWPIFCALPVLVILLFTYLPNS